jgi:hypothetical protein
MRSTGGWPRTPPIAFWMRPFHQSPRQGAVQRRQADRAVAHDFHRFVLRSRRTVGPNCRRALDSTSTPGPPPVRNLPGTRVPETKSDSLKLCGQACVQPRSRRSPRPTWAGRNRRAAVAEGVLVERLRWSFLRNLHPRGHLRRRGDCESELNTASRLHLASLGRR